jgi:hypothetical protein
VNRPAASRRTGAAGLALAVTGLGAVVAVASRGSWRNGRGSAGFSVSTTAIGAVLMAGAVVAAAFAVAAGRLMWSERTGTARRPTPWWLQLVRIAIMVFVLVALGSALPRLREHRGALPAPGSAATSSTAVPDNTQSHSATAATVIGALAAAALVFMLIAARRPPEENLTPAPTADDAAAAHQAVALALADARLETDPRRAVLAAYAGMEARLAEVGLARRPSEAPLEYLARALERLQVSGAAAHRLTELFERVGFGSGTVAASVRDEALAALEAVADELKARDAS